MALGSCLDGLSLGGKETAKPAFHRHGHKPFLKRRTARFFQLLTIQTKVANARQAYRLYGEERHCLPLGVAGECTGGVIPWQLPRRNRGELLRRSLRKELHERIMIQARRITGFENQVKQRVQASGAHPWS